MAFFLKRLGEIGERVASELSSLAEKASLDTLRDELTDAEFDSLDLTYITPRVIGTTRRRGRVGERLHPSLLCTRVEDVRTARTPSAGSRRAQRWASR